MFIPVHDDAGHEGLWVELARPTTLRLAASLWVAAGIATAWNVLGSPAPLVSLALVVLPIPIAMGFSILVALARLDPHQERRPPPREDRL